MLNNESRRLRYIPGVRDVLPTDASDAVDPLDAIFIDGTPGYVGTLVLPVYTCRAIQIDHIGD